MRRITNIARRIGIGNRRKGPKDRRAGNKITESMFERRKSKGSRKGDKPS